MFVIVRSRECVNQFLSLLILDRMDVAGQAATFANVFARCASIREERKRPALSAHFTGLFRVAS